MDAEKDIVTAGPYKLSFDLGINKSLYNISTNTPSSSGGKSTEYDIMITDTTDAYSMADIILTHYDDEIDPDAALAEWLQRLRSVSPENSGVLASARMIDGAVGTVGPYITNLNGNSVQNYGAFYFPIFEPDTLVCEIYSSYHWDRGTVRLLETIHVEK